MGPTSSNLWKSTEKKKSTDWMLNRQVQLIYCVQCPRNDQSKSKNVCNVVWFFNRQFYFLPSSLVSEWPCWVGFLMCFFILIWLHLLQAAIQKGAKARLHTQCASKPSLASKPGGPRSGQLNSASCAFSSPFEFFCIVDWVIHGKPVLFVGSILLQQGSATLGMRATTGMGQIDHWHTYYYFLDYHYYLKNSQHNAAA